MYKQANTICKPKRIPLFALIINCTILMKTNYRFSRNVYPISDRKWCNTHLRHTTTEKYERNGKDGYFRFDYDNNMSYRYILSITLLKWASWTHITPYIVMKINLRNGMADWHGTKTVCVIHSWPWYWLVWPWWGGRMYRIVTGVTSDVGVPSTYLKYIWNIAVSQFLCNPRLPKFECYIWLCEYSGQGVYQYG